MQKITAVGSRKFVLGFQLAGVRSTVVDESNIKDVFNSLLIDKEIGIVITSPETMGMLDKYLRYKVEISIKPIFVILSSTSAGQDALRKKIQKAIGVDVWDK